MSTLLVICGLSFSGKSTLARAISEKLDFQQVDVDQVGADLYGGAAIADWDFDRVYAEADAQIERLLASGVDVVDASRNFTRVERGRARELTRQSNSRLVTIYVDTPVAVARQRRRDNAASGNRRDITDAQFEEIVQVFQPPALDERPLVFQVDDVIESWIAKNEAVIRQR